VIGGGSGAGCGDEGGGLRCIGDLFEGGWGLGSRLGVGGLLGEGAAGSPVRVRFER